MLLRLGSLLMPFLFTSQNMSLTKSRCHRDSNNDDTKYISIGLNPSMITCEAESAMRETLKKYTTNLQ